MLFVRNPTSSRGVVVRSVVHVSGGIVDNVMAIVELSVIVNGVEGNDRKWCVKQIDINGEFIFFFIYVLLWYI